MHTRVVTAPRKKKEEAKKLQINIGTKERPESFKETLDDQGISEDSY